MSNDDSREFEKPIDPERFKAFVRSYLGLAAHASDAELREALALREAGLLSWYDARLKAINEYINR